MCEYHDCAKKMHILHKNWCTEMAAIMDISNNQVKIKQKNKISHNLTLIICFYPEWI